jgi:hypothetical protein
MAGIAGRGTTYNLPNFHGELFALGRQDTPFLSAIGGLLGGTMKTVAATEFEWQTYDLRAPDITRQRLEGADAPTAGARVRGNVTNVVEIHQEAIDVSYTKLAATAAMAGANLAIAEPAINEAAWQISNEIKAIARDVNATYLRGVYQRPADNTTPRKTRGLNTAITTNVTAVAANAPLTKKVVLDAMQQAWINGGWREDETRTIITGAIGKRQLTDIFVTQAGYQEQSRNVGGVNVQTIETDFGKANIMLEPAQAADTLTFASLDVIKPVGLEIPGKGVFFVEPLAKTGASERSQIYGEFGLEYGAEIQHAKITGFGPAA